MTFDDDAPTAGNDSVTQWTENQAVTFDAFANDAFGADGVDFSKVVWSTPQFGTLTLDSSTGLFTYTPFPGASGKETIGYGIEDGDGDFANATITIELQPDSEPTVSVTDGVVDEKGLPAGSGEVADPALDSDPSETTTGVITVGFGGDTPGTLLINGIDVTTGGTVTTSLGVLTVTNNAGSYSWSYTLSDNTLTHTNTTNAPPPGDRGVADQVFDNFTVVVEDSEGETATDTLTIAINDDGPTAANDTMTQSVENQPITFDAFANDVFGADGVDFSKVVWSVPQFGTLTLNSNTGLFTYTPFSGVSGTETIGYGIEDRDGDFANATITIELRPNSKPTVSVTDGVVDEKGLATGSGEVANPAPNTDNSETTVGTFTIGTGNDTLGALEVQNNAGTWVNVTAATAGSPITVQGVNGVLKVTSDGAGHYSWSYTLAHKLLTHDDTLVDGDSDRGTADQKPGEAFGVRVTDNEGAVSGVTTLDITVNDDGPIATAEASQSVAEGATITGTLDFVAGADGASVTHINGTLLSFGGDGYSQSINLGSGFLKVKADGSYSFTANNPTVSPVAPINATYTVRDGDGDTATASIAFQVTDAHVPTGGSAAATVDDDGLTGGNAASTIGDLNANAGEVPLNASEAIYTGTLGGSVGGDGAGANGFKFAASLNGQAGVAVGTETVTYSVVGNVLTATVDSGVRSGTPLFKVEITDQATGAYKVTLLDNVLHTGGPNDEATDASVSLGYLITDADGSSAPGTLTVTFDDDAPTAVSDLAQASPNQVGAKFDMLLIVDTSGSMDGVVSGVPSTFGFGNTRIALARVALLDLINQSNVDEVKIVKFGSDATSTVWMSKADAIAYVLNAANFATGGATDYDAALQVAKQAFQTAPSTVDPRVVNFLSDGEPTESGNTGSTGILESDTDNSGFGGLGEESHWINFLAANNVVRSSAFGFGGLNATNANNLEPIAWQAPEVAGTNTTAAQDGNVIVVNDTNIALLGSVLQSTVPGTASGNVLTNGTGDAFGADGGRILSIEINGKVYTWNGLTGAAARIDPGTPGVAGDDLVATSLTSILTPDGGRLTFNFLTGGWSYTTPANVNASMPDEVFTYKLIDGDGDVSSATLTIDLVPIPTTPQIFTPPGGLIPFWTTDTTDAAQTFINRVSFFDGDNPASVRVAIASPNGGDAFTAASGGGVTVGGSGTGVITLDGTIADINAFLAGNNVAWNPAGAGIPSNQADRTLLVSIDDNGLAAGGNVASKSLILDHKTVTFSGNGDTANFAGWNLNEGATTLINTQGGSDTVVTSWSHGPSTQDVHYEGSNGTGIRSRWSSRRHSLRRSWAARRRLRWMPISTATLPVLA